MILYLCSGLVLFAVMGIYSIRWGKKDGNADNDIRKWRNGRIKTIFDEDQKRIFKILLIVSFIAPQILAHIFLHGSKLWCTGQGLILTLSVFIGCWRFYMFGADDAETERKIQERAEQYHVL